MPLPSERDPRLYVEDMIEFCDRALEYAQGLDRDGIQRDRMRYDAILRNLELMGEAATHVSPKHRELALGIPWRQIVATRNRLIHAYLGIDADTIWSILSDDLPAVRPALATLLEQMPG